MPSVTSKKLEKLRAEERRLDRLWERIHETAPKKALAIRKRYFKVADAMIREFDRLQEKTRPQDRPEAKKKTLPISEHGATSPSEAH